MGPSRIVSVLALASLSGCPDPTVVADAPTHDAPAPDASVDAAMLDGAALDAGSLDAPGPIDAPMPIDAPRGDTPRGDAGPCGPADVTFLQLANDIVIARDGTLYYTFPGGVGRLVPGGSLENGWLSTFSAGIVVGLTLDAANESLYLTAREEGDDTISGVHRVTIATREVTQIVAGGFPYGVAFGPDGDLYFADIVAEAVRRVSATGGTPTTVTTARIGSPRQIAFAADGTLLVTSGELGFLLRLTLAAGTETGRTTIAPLPSPTGLAIDALDLIYVSSDGAGAIFRFAADGTGMTTFASSLSAPTGMDFGYGALCETDLYVALSGGGRRFEVGTPGAAVPWH